MRWCPGQPSTSPRRAFLPGAEGAARRKGYLWTVSESTARPYHAKGGRPVVPMVARFDVSGFADWARPH